MSDQMIEIIETVDHKLAKIGDTMNMTYQELNQSMCTNQQEIKQRVDMLNATVAMHTTELKSKLADTDSQLQSFNRTQTEFSAKVDGLLISLNDSVETSLQALNTSLTTKIRTDILSLNHSLQTTTDICINEVSEMSNRVNITLRLVAVNLTMISETFEEQSYMYESKLTEMANSIINLSLNQSDIAERLDEALTSLNHSREEHSQEFNRIETAMQTFDQTLQNETEALRLHFSEEIHNFSISFNVSLHEITENLTLIVSTIQEQYHNLNATDKWLIEAQQNLSIGLQDAKESTQAWQNLNDSTASEFSKIFGHLSEFNTTVQHTLSNNEMVWDSISQSIEILRSDLKLNISQLETATAALNVSLENEYSVMLSSLSNATEHLNISLHEVSKNLTKVIDRNSEQINHSFMELNESISSVTSDQENAYNWLNESLVEIILRANNSTRHMIGFLNDRVETIEHDVLWNISAQLTNQSYGLELLNTTIDLELLMLHGLVQNIDHSTNHSITHLEYALDNVNQTAQDINKAFNLSMEVTRGEISDTWANISRKIDERLDWFEVKILNYSLVSNQTLNKASEEIKTLQTLLNDTIEEIDEDWQYLKKELQLINFTTASYKDEITEEIQQIVPQTLNATTAILEQKILSLRTNLSSDLNETWFKINNSLDTQASMLTNNFTHDLDSRDQEFVLQLQQLFNNSETYNESLNVLQGQYDLIANNMSSGISAGQILSQYILPMQEIITSLNHTILSQNTTFVTNFKDLEHSISYELNMTDAKYLELNQTLFCRTSENNRSPVFTDQLNDTIGQSKSFRYDSFSKSQHLNYDAINYTISSHMPSKFQIDE